MARELTDVLKKILEKIPETHTALIDRLKSVQDSAYYCPPEQMTVYWKMVGRILKDSMAYRIHNTPWCQEVISVWMDSPLPPMTLSASLDLPRMQKLAQSVEDTSAKAKAIIYASGWDGAEVISEYLDAIASEMRAIMEPIRDLDTNAIVNEMDMSLPNIISAYKKES